MNHKRGFVAFLVAFVFIFFFGFVWHGMLMKPSYLETASLWRATDDFNRHFPLLILGHAVMAFALTGLYVSKVGVNSVGTGFGYGIVIGIFAVGVELIRFATQPLTSKILCLWIIGDLLQLGIAGGLIGAIYKPRSVTAT